MRDGALENSDDDGRDGRHGRGGAIARPTVVLLHTVPDGRHHYDWMVARDHTESSRLQTWRCIQRVDALEIGASIALTPLADHRRMYLNFEGTLDPKDGIDRGHVKRVQSGTWTNVESDEIGIVRWDGEEPQTLWIQAGDGEIRVTRVA